MSAVLSSPRRLDGLHIRLFLITISSGGEAQTTSLLSTHLDSDTGKVSSVLIQSFSRNSSLTLLSSMYTSQPSSSSTAAWSWVALLIFLILRRRKQSSRRLGRTGP
ncbi:hypothetical protein C8R45DRAFT_997913 [Mycena sanguinolenta]|nr:hypothetical protein C8R45DRAFT_997913 [Mycena sanguinolenta]